MLFEASAPRPGHILLGVGCDTELRARLGLVLERRPSFLERWFTPQEQAAIRAAADGLGLALRLFCLKEAAVKALWPQCKLSPRAIQAEFAGEVVSLCLVKGQAGLVLEGWCQCAATHAEAQVLAWQLESA